MGQEIERKFLVVRELWEPKGEGVRIAQGYLNADPERTVRVRVKGNMGYLTVKGKNEGIARKEFEYEIPLEDAEEMLKLCALPIIEKRRFREKVEGHTWEVDAFSGDNRGLLLAEIELQEENESFKRPEWLGREVSEDPRYYNSNLSRHPFGRW